VRKRRFQKGSLSVQKIGGRKVWYAQWRENGGRRTKVLGPCSTVTKSQAQAQLAAILAPINAGLTAPPVRIVSFGEFIERVYLPWQELSWKDSTAATTKQRVQGMILPVFEHHLIRFITREELQEFLIQQARHYSISVVRHLRWDLNSIFKLAMSDGLVMMNPAAALRVPKKCQPGRPKRALTEAEVVQYLEALDLPAKLIARLAIFEGMRPGEIYSLRWSDMSGPSCYIERRVYQGVFDSPKSNRGRQAALSQGTAQLLATWHDQCLTPADGWVFASSKPSSPLRPDNTWKKHFLPRLEKIGLEWASFQALRKTNATLMQKYGADAKAGADQRGHGLGVSMAVYTESDIETKRTAVQVLEDAVLRVEERQAEKLSA